MRPQLNHILVAVDGSEAAGRAAAFAGELAHLAGAKLTLLYVFDRSDLTALSVEVMSLERMTEVEQTRAQDAFTLARRAIGDQPPRISEQRAVGRPAAAIVEITRQLSVDLLVVGSRGRSQLTEVLLGSTAQGVVHHAPCPVTVVH